MKIFGNKMIAGTVALLALSGAYGVRADDAATIQPAPNETTANRNDVGQTRTSEGTPMKYNKASGLIGMAVKNQNGEHLGHITDVVFDLKSDRVSYVVLTTTSKATLGIDDKLLAVPLSAFTTSPDEKHLILNADKSKLKSAMGFNGNNWPDVGNPSWGSQPFWQNPNGQPVNQNYSNGRVSTPPNQTNNQPDNQPPVSGPPTSGTRPGEQGNPPKSGQ
jgi:sporulation protein YlmC with PRC-barrel domain